MSQSDIYTILCVIDNEDVAFPVEIDKNKIIGQLKGEIIKKMPTFANMDPYSLDLYHVDIPNANRAELKASVKNEPLDSPQLPSQSLIEIFPTGPKPHTVHFIVKPAESTPLTFSTSSPSPHIPTRDNKSKKRIVEFATNLRSAFKTLLTNDVQLPLWEPLWGTEEVRSHITGLKIPLISQSPSLLLHNLGQPSHDAQLMERIDKLFSPRSGKRFLCNTSGSGKTRLLLEGLWRNWGFYFTARTKPEGVGSSDLENVLRDLDLFGNLKPLIDDHRSDVKAENNKVADHRALVLFYARTFILRVFLEAASVMPGGITENHKGQWLLIQVTPDTLLARPDVFWEFTKLAGRFDSDCLLLAVITECNVIRSLLPHSTDLFCVLDEAQVPANMFLDCFRSYVEPAQRQGILHQITRTWRLRGVPDLIVAGTGASMREVETYSDAVAAAGGPLPTMTDVGGFDDEVSQRAYLEQYLPPGFLDTPLGEEVASRASYWLRGRYHFTATYISRLLRTGFESPHQVLNEFVHGMTGFRPSDCGDGPSVPVELGKPDGFDFSTLLKMSEKKPDPLTTLASFVFEYIITGKISGLEEPNGDDMVEYGVSRFKNSSGYDPRVAETNEPLAILGLVTFLGEHQLTLERRLRGPLSVANASARSIAFKPFGAYLIARAFSTPTLLSEVFEFVGKSKLEDELAELVTLERVDGTIRINPLDLTSGLNLRSHHVVGCSPSTAADTLEWLQNPRGSAFCFPADTVGPDLIFVLRLTRDGTVLRVCVQFKDKKKLRRMVTMDLRTTYHFMFVSHFEEDQWTISDPLMPNDMVQAIQNLGDGTKNAGECGVLRVVVSHPSLVDDDTLYNATKNDHGHPLARMSLGLLESPDSDLGQAILGLANRWGLKMPDRKRKRSDEIDGAKSKRPNTGTEVRR